MQKLHPAQKIKSSSKEVTFEEDFFNSHGKYVHPTCIIGPHVTLGENVKVGPFCSIFGNVTIGDNTRIHGYTIIGAPAQVVGQKDSFGTIQIGKSCELREFIAVHASRYPDGKTIIGDNCYIMNYCHVAHDVILEHNVTLINNVNLGGHTHIEHHVMMMANSATHQFTRVGSYAALTPFTGIRQDAPPFCILHKQPGRFAGLNRIALKRSGFSSEQIDNLNTVTKLWHHKKISLEEIKEQSKTTPWGSDTNVQYFLKFIEKSKRGVSKKSVLDT